MSSKILSVALLFCTFLSGIAFATTSTVYANTSSVSTTQTKLRKVLEGLESSSYKLQVNDGSSAIFSYQIYYGDKMVGALYSTNGSDLVIMNGWQDDGHIRTDFNLGDKDATAVLECFLKLSNSPAATTATSSPTVTQNRSQTTMTITANNQNLRPFTERQLVLLKSGLRFFEENKRGQFSPE